MSTGAINSERSTNFSLKESISGEITSLARNKQGSHINAVSASNGTAAEHDTKQKKSCCEIRSAEVVTDLAWNPTEGLHMIIESDDNWNPSMKLRDLCSLTSVPAVMFQPGHV